MNMACPMPHKLPEIVTLAHGGGGTAMHALVEGVFGKAFANELLELRCDAAVLPAPNGRLAFTTDSFVVQPLEFPGGDIGSLAVYGTVNDLAMTGARPLYLSAGFILEEGFPVERLQRIAASMGKAAERAGVRIVTGDTKVIERRGGDGLFINTAGIGVVDDAVDLGPQRVAPGDTVIVSGDLGRHGMAVMAAREGLGFESDIESDAAPLARSVMALLDAGVEVHCLRDLTRGGLASAINEIAFACGHEVRIVEAAVPVREDVRGACEVLGLDPVYVANEGRFAAFVAAGQAGRALDALRGASEDCEPAAIGEVCASRSGRVTVESVVGVTRTLDMLSGDPIPRIC
jgi:hydrogenase expression/formation protein HypE